MRRGFEGEDHVTLGCTGFRLIVHAIKEALPEGNSAEGPPKVRRQTPVKLSFCVGSIRQAREKAISRGGEIYGTDREWTYRGQRFCDGHDPEGNVFQISEYIPNVD